MNTSLGYSKKTLTDSNVLLSGGGDKALSEFIGSLNWDSTNKKLQYKSASSTNFTDLITFGSNAFTSYSGYNIVFLNNEGTTVDTFKALTSPSKTLKAGTNVQMTAASNVITITATDTTYSVFTGASSSAAGSTGLVKQPAKGDQGKFLRGDCTWQSLTSNVTTALYVGASNGTGTAAQSTNGNVYLILKEGSSYSRYKIAGSGRASVTSDANGNITINSSGYSNFGAATSSAAGSAGLVPGPGANILGSGGYFLRADGSWAVPTNTWKEVSTSQEGYVPKIITTGSLVSSDNPFILVYKNVSGTTKSVWVPLPANAFNNTWTAADFTNAGYVPKSVKGKFLHAKSDTGALEWVDDNNTWDAASTSKAGYVPKLATGGGTIASSDAAYVLVYKSGVNGATAPVWMQLPTNAYNNTWTAGSSSAAGYVPAATKGKFLHSNASTGNLEWTNDNNTWKAANTSLEGYVPKLALNATDTIAAQSSEYVLTYINGTETAPVWRKLPTGAFNTVNNGILYIKSSVNSTATELARFGANQSGSTIFTLIKGDNITFTNDTTNHALTIAGTPNTWRPIYLGNSELPSNKSIKFTYTAPITISTSYSDSWDYFEMNISLSKTTTNVAATTLTKGTWKSVAYVPSSSSEGLYILYFKEDGCSYAGLFSYNGDSSDYHGEEIIFHTHGAGRRIYAKVSAGSIYITTDEDSITTDAMTFKFVKLI